MAIASPRAYWRRSWRRAAGSYGTITVRHGASLVLTGGIYHAAAFDLRAGRAGVGEILGYKAGATTRHRAGILRSQ